MTYEEAIQVVATVCGVLHLQAEGKQLEPMFLAGLIPDLVQAILRMQDAKEGEAKNLYKRLQAGDNAQFFSKQLWDKVEPFIIES